MIHVCLSRKAASQFANGLSLTTIVGRLEKHRPLTPSIPDLTGRTIVLHDYTWMDTAWVKRLLACASTAGATVIFQEIERHVVPIDNGIQDLRRTWERRAALANSAGQRTTGEVVRRAI